MSILYQNMLWFQVIPLLMGNLPIFFSYLLRYRNEAGAKVRDNVNLLLYCLLRYFELSCISHKSSKKRFLSHIFR